MSVSNSGFARSKFIGDKLRLLQKALCIFLLLCGIVLNGKSGMIEGERLYIGQHLMSSEGRYKMGINDAGILEIIDLRPPQDQEKIVPGWDGKTLWRAKYLKRTNTADYGYARCSGSTGSNYFDEFIQRCSNTECWSSSEVVPVEDAYYFTFTSMPNFETIKYVQLFDKNDKKLWEMQIELSVKYHHPTEHGYASVPTEAVLYLDNYGRASIFTEKKMVWCTCPYCYLRYNDKDDCCIVIDCKNYNLYFHDEKLGIPRHSEISQEKLRWVLTVTGGMYFPDVNFSSTDDWRFVTFDEFWSSVKTRSKYQSRTGMELKIPDRTGFDKAYYPPSAVSASAGPSMTTGNFSYGLNAFAYKGGSLQTSTSDGPFVRCLEAKHESYANLISRVKAESR